MKRRVVEGLQMAAVTVAVVGGIVYANAQYTGSTRGELPPVDAIRAAELAYKAEWGQLQGEQPDWQRPRATPVRPQQQRRDNDGLLQRVVRWLT